MSLNIFLYLSSFSTDLLTILFPLLYIYILIIQFWHSTSINARLSKRFKASLLWMLPSLFCSGFIEWLVPPIYATYKHTQIDIRSYYLRNIREGGDRAVYFPSPQSFTITERRNKFGDHLIEFWLFGALSWVSKRFNRKL